MYFDNHLRNIIATYLLVHFSFFISIISRIEWQKNYKLKLAQNTALTDQSLLLNLGRKTETHASKKFSFFKNLLIYPPRFTNSTHINVVRTKKENF